MSKGKDKHSIKNIVRRYPQAVYGFLISIGAILLLLPYTDLLTGQTNSSIAINLGAGLITSGLIFLVLEYFYISNGNNGILEDDIKDIVIKTLTEGGIMKNKHEFTYYSNVIRLKREIPFDSEEYEDTSKLRMIIKENVKKLDKDTNIGKFDKTRIRYFVNFMNIANSPDQLYIASNYLCNSICKLYTDEELRNSFDKIASPKEGNPALAYSIALRLEKPLVYVDITRNYVYLNPLEGEVNPGDRFIIVHDIVASGQLINICARELRSKGAKVEHAFVLVERTDRKKKNKKTPSDLLRTKQLKLNAILQIGDEELSTI